MFEASKIEALLERLCVDLGFCLPAHARQRLVQQKHEDEAAFVEQLFRAEGLDPETADRRLVRQVRDRVAETVRPDPSSGE